MKYGYVLVGLISSLYCSEQAPTAITCEVNASAYQAMPICIMIPQAEKGAPMLADLIKALEFTGQFKVELKNYNTIPHKKELSQIWEDGCPYAFFLHISSPTHCEWRLYDTSAASMIKGKRQHIKGPSRGLSYAIADAWWKELTGSPGFFSCKVAYCKEVRHGKRQYKHIFIADYDGNHEELLVATPTINIAPRWNTDAEKPLLFYSESTNANVRLMASTMDKKRIMASNFDGLNMLPIFSRDGKTVIYCATRGAGNCQLYGWHNKELKRITNNTGNNIAPTFADSDDIIYFVSDFESAAPQMYKLNLKTGAQERVTTEGYCVSPSYNNVNHTVAYSKMVNGVMQLFVYDEQTKKHTQLTHDPAQKEECAWAPDGIHLLCPVQAGKRQQIAYFNTITKQYQFLTKPTMKCSYPMISGTYAHYPTISA